MNDSAQTPNLEGLKVLVVEDEAPIALQLEDMLSEFGCDVVGPASRVGQALKLLEGQQVDVAVLDLNIAGELVYPVADALAKRGLPHLFVTGYGADALATPYRGRPVLEKPFPRRALRQVMLAALRGDH